MESIVEFSECFIDFIDNYKDLINLAKTCKSYYKKTKNLRNDLKEIFLNKDINFTTKYPTWYHKSPLIITPGFKGIDLESKIINLRFTIFQNLGSKHIELLFHTIKIETNLKIKSITLNGKKHKMHFMIPYFFAIYPEKYTYIIVDMEIEVESLKETDKIEIHLMTK